MDDKIQNFYFKVENYKKFREIRAILCQKSYLSDKIKTNVNSKKLSRFIFRGQMDSTWGLETSLERLIKKTTPATQKILTSNSNQETTFRDIYNSFILNNKTDKDSPNGESYEPIHSWITRCQHMGGPTRLLDFTYSFDIATFFALYEVLYLHAEQQNDQISDKENKNASIYLINQANILNNTWINPDLNDIEGDKNNSWDFFKRSLENENSSQNGINILLPKQMIDYYKKNSAYQMTELGLDRIITQEGLFLYACNSQLSFQSQLFGSSSKPVEILTKEEFKVTLENKTANKHIRTVIRIDIPHLFAKEILKFLAEKKNIRYMTLFPDEPGFFQGLKYDMLINIWGNIRPKGSKIDPYCDNESDLPTNF